MPELSTPVQSRLETARTNQNEFTPSEIAARRIGEKVLIMLVGPPTIGKTYTMDHVTLLDEDFLRVPVFTSRSQRPDDELGMFRYTPHTDEGITELLDDIDSPQSDVIQYAVHPTTGEIYGTVADDYPGKYNMLATLSGVVESMRQLPFKDTFVVALVTEGHIWAQQFSQRYPAGHPDREKRLKEAQASMKWLLSQEPGAVQWVYNVNGSPEQTAQSIVDVVKNQKPADENLRQKAEDLLEVIETMYNNNARQKAPIS